MIDLYYWTTPNGHKITIFLEEAGLEYRIIPVDIGIGDQFKPDFQAIAPNKRIPAIIDTAPADGGTAISVFESGANLQYLAERTAQFLPTDVRGRTEMMQWLFSQMGGLGPMAGQNHHFVQFAPEKIPYAMTRYVKETNRLYGVLDRRLTDSRFVANAYSIADMAAHPWVIPHERQQLSLEDFPHLTAGSRQFARGRLRNAPMRSQAGSTRHRWSTTSCADFCSARQQHLHFELAAHTAPSHRHEHVRDTVNTFTSQLKRRRIQ